MTASHVLERELEKDETFVIFLRHHKRILSTLPFTIDQQPYSSLKFTATTRRMDDSRLSETGRACLAGFEVHESGQWGKGNPTLAKVIGSTQHKLHRVWAKLAVAECLEGELEVELRRSHEDGELLESWSYTSVYRAPLVPRLKYHRAEPPLQQVA